MKIYSDTLTDQDVRQAFQTARQANNADIWIGAMREFRPRHHVRGIEIFAYSQNGKRASGHAPIGSYSRDNVLRAASWTDYGYVIAYLYNSDPSARIGSYDSKTDFVQKVHSWLPKGQSLAFLTVLA
jgi:hypothetical protein